MPSTAMPADLPADPPDAGSPGPRTARTLQVGLLLYPMVEVLDFAGPYEVFTTASRLAWREQPHAAPPFAVRTVARQAGLVRARAGLQAWADVGFDTAGSDAPGATPPLDLLLVPGGVVDAELGQADTRAWLRTQAATAGLVASVCTGALLLADAGLLPAGSTVTTHWEDLDALRRLQPDLNLRGERRYVDLGRVLTSAGISAGIDMSLHLVARLTGMALAERTARQLDVVWTRDSG